MTTRPWRRLVGVVAALVVLFLTGCTADVGNDVAFTRDTPRQALAQVFLVEHFNVATNGAMRAHLRNNPPGGILFWNGNQADAATLRDVVRAYSEETKAHGHPPVLFSADYEGGGSSGSAMGLDPRGYKISGVQRFRKGFTALAHPRWIGTAYDHDPELGLELARLHGTIMARELRSVGLFFPLSVVGDLAKGLMKVRGLHPDETVTAVLLQEILRGFFGEPGMVFDTKHFPGLGDGVGDTHDEVVTIDHDEETAEAHLVPFEAAIAASEEFDAARLSIMCGHAKYPHFDAENMTTVSPAILQGLLRDDLGFEGLSVSDAMWMGPYGQMGSKSLYRIYLQSFLAGMDLLMIPGSRFSGSLSYFESVLLGTLSASEVAILEDQLGTDIATIRETMEDRLEATLERIDATKATMTHAVDVTEGLDATPASLTETERARYHAILIEVDARWEPLLP